MPNKTAYMQAYEAGVKLATYNYIEKVAKPLNAKQEQAPSGIETPEPTQEGPDFYGDLAASIRRGVDTAGDYLSTAGTNLSTAGTNLYNRASDAVGSIADVFNPTNSGVVDAKTKSFGAPSMTMDPNRSLGLGGAPLTMENFSLPTQATRTQQPQQAPAPAPAVDPVEQFEREQEQRALNTFDVGRGGYGRQLSRFREQFGQGNEDLFEGEDAINYRDFAKAMDNRALQVGDTFDARDVLNKLREMRYQRGNISSEAFMGPPTQVGIQRRGRDVNRFQTLAQQRNAMQRIRDRIKLPEATTPALGPSR